MSTETFDFSLEDAGGAPRGGGDSIGAGADGAWAEVSGPTFWETLYARGEDGWGLGAPAPRPECREAVRRILKPNGTLAALFYPLREGSGGPPFPVSQDEIRRLFEP